MLPSWLLKELKAGTRVDYGVGVCEAFMQRTHEPKSQALSYARGVFALLGSGAGERPSLEIAYESHLASYAALLGCLSHRSIAVHPEEETSKFIHLLQKGCASFDLRRLTHLSGNDSPDGMAAAAWNTAWDMTLLSHCVNNGLTLVTHDRALAEYAELFTPSLVLDTTKKVPRIKPGLVKALEQELQVAQHYDANLPYAGGLRRL